uniref:Uncharacterized protein n=1 Tax=Leersia perrieri TaxID=77586 RepID=A0A0D9VXD1_9ORYZ
MPSSLFSSPLFGYRRPPRRATRELTARRQHPSSSFALPPRRRLSGCRQSRAAVRTAAARLCSPAIPAAWRTVGRRRWFSGGYERDDDEVGLGSATSSVVCLFGFATCCGASAAWWRRRGRLSPPHGVAARAPVARSDAGGAGSGGPAPGSVAPTGARARWWLRVRLVAAAVRARADGGCGRRGRVGPTTEVAAARAHGCSGGGYSGSEGAGRLPVGRRLPASWPMAGRRRRRLKVRSASSLEGQIYGRHAWIWSWRGWFLRCGRSAGRWCRSADGGLHGVWVAL